MDRNQAKEFYPILQAFAEGKTIETRRKPTADNNGVTKDGWFEFNDWTEMKELEYWVNVEYRIKPKPTYRPYHNLKECFHDMKNHEPFGYIRQKQKGDLELITGTLDDEHEYLKLSVSVMSTLNTVFERYTYFDGSPFGIKKGNDYE